MRRSGISSRSKCAIFSISQISCSSAGPRGPAVMMLVLSATGAPVALVNRFVVRLPGTEARLAVVTVGRLAMEFLFYCERWRSGNSAHGAGLLRLARNAGSQTEI